jgi:hypothetical protein
LLKSGCYHWVSGNWRTIDELRLVKEAVLEVAGKLGGPSRFRNAFHNRMVDIHRVIDLWGDIGGLAVPIGDVYLDNVTFYSTSERGEAYSRYTVAHELGHIWDIREYFEISSGLGRSVGTIQTACMDTGQGFCIEYEYYSPTSYKEIAPGSKGETEIEKYAYTNVREDWAEAFASYIYPVYWSTYRGGDDMIVNGIRWTYVETQIQKLP